MVYTCTGCETGDSAQVTISGTNLIVNANTVNLSIINVANWSTTKIANVDASSSPYPGIASVDFNIPITVVPCSITALAITDITASINSSSTQTHGNF